MGIFRLIDLLLSPIGIILLVMVAGLVLAWRHRRSGMVLLTLGLVLFYLASTRFAVEPLIAILESSPPLTRADLDTPSAGAIVILGAGRREVAPDFNPPLNQRPASGDTLSANALERVRYGAWLARQTQLPLLVSGGLADSDGPAEAEMMQHVIEAEFGIKVQWVEPMSRNTYENAGNSAALLRDAGIETIYLVTHVMHIPRAQWSFRQFGIEALPAPTAYWAESGDGWQLTDFLPDARALLKLTEAMHEVVGMLWYRLRY